VQATELAQPAPVEIPPPARVRYLVLMSLALLALYLCFRVLKPFTSVLLWSGVLAVLFAPLRARLVARTGRPNLAATLTLLIALVCVLLPLAAVMFAVAAEVSEIATTAPAGVDELLESPDLEARALELYDQVVERVPLVERIDRQQLGASIRSVGTVLSDRAMEIAGSALQGAVELVLIAFTLFFLLRDGEQFAERLRDLLPLGRRRADRLITSVIEVLRASTFGVVIVAAVQGFLGGVMFAALGLPSPVLWGVVMALFGLIPLLGTAVVWLPAVAYLYLTGDTAKALILLGWGALVVGTIDNVLRPFVVGKRAHLHELVVFFGVLGGLKLFGLVGVFVGPALFSIAASLIALARERGDADAPEAQPKEAAA
jgi:predicted PurR-regulated permease PerM